MYVLDLYHNKLVTNLPLFIKKNQNKKLVFTNGCFDILHIGHIDYLIKAKSFGDVLFVGINSDISVKLQQKDKIRPVLSLENRMAILSSLYFVDFVASFDEVTPYHLIMQLMPNILVKGADWSIKQISGATEVIANGGSVELIEFKYHISTTSIINDIINKYTITKEL